MTPETLARYIFAFLGEDDRDYREFFRLGGDVITCTGGNLIQSRNQLSVKTKEGKILKITVTEQEE